MIGTKIFKNVQPSYGTAVRFGTPYDTAVASNRHIIWVKRLLWRLPAKCGSSSGKCQPPYGTGIRWRWPEGRVDSTCEGVGGRVLLWVASSTRNQLVAEGKGHQRAGVHTCRHQPHATLIETKKIYKSQIKHQN
jgi:hypothetical protein